MGLPANTAPLDEVLLYTDGGSRGNPGEAAVCHRVLSLIGAVLEERAARIGRATNNQAEYRALIAGLEACARLGARRVACRSDSELVVRQLRGEYRAKDPALRELAGRVRALEEEFAAVAYEHRSRSDPDIARADRLLNAVLDRQANEASDGALQQSYRLGQVSHPAVLRALTSLVGALDC
jgi:ribonuclease HI